MSITEYAFLFLIVFLSYIIVMLMIPPVARLVDVMSDTVASLILRLEEWLEGSPK